MKNIDVAHNFFYDTKDFYRKSMNVSYTADGRFLSYGTCIAQIVETINDNDMCIISYNHFSNTTRRHIGEIREACNIPYIFLPQEWYGKEFKAAPIFNILKAKLALYSQSKLTKKENRKVFKETFIMLQDCIKLKMFEPYQDDIITILSEYRELYNILLENEEERKAKLKQREAEKQEKLKAQLKDIIENYSYIQQIKQAYKDDGTFEKDIKYKLREYLNPNLDLSFIWFENDKLKTSQHVLVDRKEATVLLKLWAKGKLKHGMMIDRYTVLEVMPTYVKVGCHKLSEFLDSIEFSYKINKNNTISLIDNLGANLAGIEQIPFKIDDKLAMHLVDWLSTYIHDYHIAPIEEYLTETNDITIYEYSYDELIEMMKQYPYRFNSTYIKFIEDITTPNIDISEVYNASNRIK